MKLFKLKMKKKKYLNYDHDLKRIFNSSKEFSFNRDNRNKGPIYLKKFLKSKNIIISNKVSSNTAVHFFAKGNLLKKKNYLIHKLCFLCHKIYGLKNLDDFYP